MFQRTLHGKRTLRGIHPRVGAVYNSRSVAKSRSKVCLSKESFRATGW